MLENFGIRDPKDVNFTNSRAVPHLIYNFLLCHEKWIEDKYLEIGSHLINFLKNRLIFLFGAPC